MKEKEIRVESYNIEDADVVISAYGTTARIAKTAITKLEKEGYKVGLLRPISLFPYPFDEFNKIKDDCKGVLTVEMNSGQMLDDVKIALNGRIPTYFYGRTGGMIPTPEEIVDKVKEIYGGVK